MSWSEGTLTRAALNLDHLPRQVLAQGLGDADTIRCLEVLEDGA